MALIYSRALLGTETAQKMSLVITGQSGKAIFFLGPSEMEGLEAKLLSITPAKDVGMAGSDGLRWKVRGRRPTNLYSILDLKNSLFLQ